MPDKCVVFGCNNRPKKEKGISLHTIPFDGTDDADKLKRRKKWVDFVKLKRAGWEPTKHSAVCSKHFLDEDYYVMFSDLAKNDFQRRMVLRFVSSQLSAYLVFQWKVNQLKASEARGR